MRHSQNQGFRARSAFKLLQILETYPELIRAIRKIDSKIVDLGAAPGSWCQVLTKFTSPTTKIVAIDLLPMEPIEHVKTVVLDFSSEYALKIIAEKFETDFKKVNLNLVTSDLCTNLSGNSCIDNLKNMELWELVLNFSDASISPNGHLVMKYFESKESVKFRKVLEKCFERVVAFKPTASRSESSEKYFICLNKKSPII